MIEGLKIVTQEKFYIQPEYRITFNFENDICISALLEYGTVNGRSWLKDSEKKCIYLDFRSNVAAIIKTLIDLQIPIK